jgi:hypothetical protein
MADNVAITAGAGTTVSTEEATTLNGGAVAAQHVQRVVVSVRTADGVVEDIPGDLVGGLAVEVTNAPDVTVVAGTTDAQLQAQAGTVLVGSVGLQPQTTGGLSIFRSLDLDETEEEVKATAGQVFGWHLFNAHATDTVYIKFYNATAANVTVGTTTPVLTIPLKAGTGANVSFDNGIAFATAITVAATTGLADADTGAPAANQVVVNLLYK